MHRPMITFHTNPEARLLVLRYANGFSFEEWALVMPQIIAQNPSLPSLDCIVDLRALASRPDVPDMKVHAARMKQYGLHEQPRRQVILTGSGVQFGMGRMFEMLTEFERKTKYLTTGSVAEAAAWLGLSEELVQAALAAAAQPDTDRPDSDGAV